MVFFYYWLLINLTLIAATLLFACMDLTISDISGVKKNDGIYNLKNAVLQRND